MSDSYLTIQQTADVLGIHWQTVRNYIKSGRLPFFKVGRSYRIREMDIRKLTSKIDEKEKRVRKEIELRYLLKDKLKTENRLRKIGAKLTNHSHIVDHYYCDQNINSIEENDLFYESSLGFFLRIREMDNDYSGRVTTTMDVKKLADTKNHGNMIETEIVVPNFQDMKNILELMNKKEYLTIDKERFVYRYEDFACCFDNIVGWGEGLEIELITDLSYEDATTQIHNFAKQIGLSDDDRIEKSLTYLALKKLAKF